MYTPSAGITLSGNGALPRCPNLYLSRLLTFGMGMQPQQAPSKSGPSRWPLAGIASECSMQSTGCAAAIKCANYFSPPVIAAKIWNREFVDLNCLPYHLGAPEQTIADTIQGHKYCGVLQHSHEHSGSPATETCWNTPPS